MVVLDTTFLMLLFRPDIKVVRFGSDGKEIDHLKERVEYLVKTLEAAKSKIVIPTPVLSEILVQANPAQAQQIVETISRSAVFRVEPFDNLAAIEVAAMGRTALATGDKKAGSTNTWAKVKFDRQIVAIARVVRAAAIYSDDADVKAIAKTVGIQVFRIDDLALPPETAQGQLPFERSRPDAIDEVADQAKTLEEPQLPPEGGPGAGN